MVPFVFYLWSQQFQEACNKYYSLDIDLDGDLIHNLILILPLKDERVNKALYILYTMGTLGCVKLWLSETLCPLVYVVSGSTFSGYSILLLFWMVGISRVSLCFIKLISTLELASSKRIGCVSRIDGYSECRYDACRSWQWLDIQNMCVIQQPN